MLCGRRRVLLAGWKCVARELALERVDRSIVVEGGGGLLKICFRSGAAESQDQVSKCSSSSQ